MGRGARQDAIQSQIQSELDLVGTGSLLGNVTVPQDDESISSVDLRADIERLLIDGDSRVAAGGIAALNARWLETPIGTMLAIANAAGLHLLEFINRKALPTEIAKLRKRHGSIALASHPVIELLSGQLQGYFLGVAEFNLPLVQHGTPFEMMVWTALQQIPVGETRSYSELARALGRPDAARAVARANGANQFAILIPCHRVIGADGSLVGYGGKLWRKQWLLAHEQHLVES